MYRDDFSDLVRWQLIDMDVMLVWMNPIQDGRDRVDSKMSSSVMTLLWELNEEGTTIAMVTHSRKCAQYAGWLLKLSGGGLLNWTGNAVAR